MNVCIVRSIRPADFTVRFHMHNHVSAEYVKVQIKTQSGGWVDLGESTTSASIAESDTFVGISQSSYA